MPYATVLAALLIESEDAYVLISWDTHEREVAGTGRVPINFNGSNRTEQKPEYGANPIELNHVCGLRRESGLCCGRLSSGQLRFLETSDPARPVIMNER